MLAEPVHTRRARRFTSATRGPSEIALACRNVGLAFVNRVAREADPRAFIAWAIRDYQRVTCVDEAAPYGGKLAGVPVENGALRETLGEARAVVLAELRSAALSQERARFAELSIGRGLVAPSFNDLAVAPRRNERGWVPVDVPQAGIAERVLALFTVDYLWNPADYSGALCICSRCEGVVFDRDARDRGYCDAHPTPDALAID
jgi:hypothetical protein